MYVFDDLQTIPQLITAELAAVHAIPQQQSGLLLRLGLDLPVYVEDLPTDPWWAAGRFTLAQVHR